MLLDLIELLFGFMLDPPHRVVVNAHHILATLERHEGLLSLLFGLSHCLSDAGVCDFIIVLRSQPHAVLLQGIVIRLKPNHGFRQLALDGVLPRQFLLLHLLPLRVLLQFESVDESFVFVHAVVQFFIEIY